MSHPDSLPETPSDLRPVAGSTAAIQVTYRHMDSSPALTRRIEEEAQKLSRYHPHIHRCHVVIEAPPHRHTDGRLVGIHFEISVPGDVLVVNHEESSHAAHDVYELVRKAFDVARRRLEDHSRRSRGDVKRHER